MMTCAICGRDFAFSWAYIHGIGRCINCGAPYRLYHYDDNKKRLDKPPELLLLPQWVEPMRRYWREVGRNVAPNAFCVPGSSYSNATDEDCDSLREWMERECADLIVSAREEGEDEGRP